MPGQDKVRRRRRPDSLELAALDLPRDQSSTYHQLEVTALDLPRDQSSTHHQLEVTALDLPRDQSSTYHQLELAALERLATARQEQPEKLTAERILHPPPVLTEDPFAEERETWSETAGWLRRVTTLPEPDELKAIKPIGGVQAEIRVNLKHARTYVAHLERLRRGGRL